MSTGIGRPSTAIGGEELAAIGADTFIITTIVCAHLRKLEDAGYIAVNKTFVERKPRTYVFATAAGRRAFQEHVAALESILKGK